MIHLKTDSRPLHDYTLEVIASHKALTLLEADADIYHSQRVPNDLVIAVQTFYENLFLAEGKPITYLKFSINTQQDIATLKE